MDATAPAVGVFCLNAITRISAGLEKRGRFSRRIRTANRKIAWRKSDIKAWAADPEAWAKRQAEGAPS
jgi:hypothetical protein